MMENGEITKSALTLCLLYITINRHIYDITTLSTLSPLLFQEQPYTLASITHPKIRLNLLFTKPKQKPMATQNHTEAEAKWISSVFWVSGVCQWLAGHSLSMQACVRWTGYDLPSLSPDPASFFFGAGFKIGLG